MSWHVSELSRKLPNRILSKANVGRMYIFDVGDIFGAARINVSRALNRATKMSESTTQNIVVRSRETSYIIV